MNDCPMLCWQFRHFDYCPHTVWLDHNDRLLAAHDAERDDIERAAQIDRVFDRD